jgi:hypothetical protein
MIKKFHQLFESASIQDELQSIINIVDDDDNINVTIWKRNNVLGLNNDPDMLSAVIGEIGKIACISMSTYDDIAEANASDNITEESMDIIRNVAARIMQLVDISIEVDGIQCVTLEQLENYDNPVSVRFYIMPRAGDFFFADDQKGYANYYLNRIVLWTHKPFNTRNGPLARLEKGVISRLTFSMQRAYVVGIQPSTGTMNAMYYDKHVVSITSSEVDLTYKYKYIIEIADD